MSLNVVRIGPAAIAGSRPRRSKASGSDAPQARRHQRVQGHGGPDDQAQVGVSRPDHGQAAEHGPRSARDDARSRFLDSTQRNSQAG